jgi:hypothetical protein
VATLPRATQGRLHHSQRSREIGALATPEVMEGAAPTASARDQASKAANSRGTSTNATRVAHGLMGSVQPRLDLIAFFLANQNFNQFQ